jgi:hypothetical protein
MNGIRTLLLLALSALLAACASGGQVTSSDMDSHADFSRYHTFAFSDPLGTNRGGADTLLSQRLKASAARQMQARGFVYQAQAPDLLVNFHAKVVEHEYSSVTFAPMFGFYSGHHHGFYAASAWPAWGYGMDDDTYNEGQLNIDLIDAAQKRQIWETVVIGDAVRATGPRADAIVDAAVTKAFRKFPVSAPVATQAGQ